jgi:hypothetical protein
MVTKFFKVFIALTMCFVLGSCTKANEEKKEDIIEPTEEPPVTETLREPVSDFIKSLDKSKPHKFVTFSFDDGTVQDNRLAELFNKYGIKCTFNINTGSLGVEGTLNLQDGNVDFTKLSAEEIKSVYEGHEVAVHTVNHPDLRTLEDEDIIKEVNDDFNTIQEVMGQKVIGMAYPGGPFYNRRVIDVIQNNTEIKYARETSSTYRFTMPNNFMIWRPTCHQSEVKNLVDKFISQEAKEDMLLYVWGHSWEFDLYDSWDEFESILKKLSEAEDLIFVTNSEIYYYLNNGF